LTQQNAALVEQASAASQAMADQARGLNMAMQGYRVKSDDEQGKPVARAGSGRAEAKPAVERRGASRPWTGKAEPPAAPAKTRVVNGDDESVWKEF
jgi:methyl-accepting chemotaxis protein